MSAHCHHKLAKSVPISRIDLADRIYLSQVHAVLPADVYFPEISNDDWQKIKSELVTADENNLYDFTFKILDRQETSN